MENEKKIWQIIVVVFVTALFLPVLAQAADKPNILLIVSDDHGYGDIGFYGGGEGRGMPTPNLNRANRQLADSSG